MSDDKTKTVQDRNFIAVGEDYEVRYWTEALDCSEQQLRSAISEVGNSADKVRTYLKGR